MTATFNAATFALQVERNLIDSDQLLAGIDISTARIADLRQRIADLRLDGREDDADRATADLNVVESDVRRTLAKILSIRAMIEASTVLAAPIADCFDADDLRCEFVPRIQAATAFDEAHLGDGIRDDVIGLFNAAAACAGIGYKERRQLFEEIVAEALLDLTTDAPETLQ